jgi:hypothetical protein
MGFVRVFQHDLAAQAGQRHVEQHHVGPELRDDAERVGPVPTTWAA